MDSLIQVQDRLISTMMKCYRSNAAKGRRGLYKQPAVRVAVNKAEHTLTVLGFTDRQAYVAVCDAYDVANLLWECEA